MSDTPITLPRDEFTVRLRELNDNPGAVRSQSRLDLADFYGRNQTWTVDTFRVEGQETAFLQRMSAEEPLRLMLPPKVMEALTRQHEGLTTKVRRKVGRRTIAERIARGEQVGNPEALAAARKARKAKAKR